MINKLELGWGKSWPNGKCKTRFVELVRHAGAVQIMFGLHSTLDCICCQIMFGLQSTLDYICCQIIISGKTFLMLKTKIYVLMGAHDVLIQYGFIRCLMFTFVVPHLVHGVYIQNHRLNTISFST